MYCLTNDDQKKNCSSRKILEELTSWFGVSEGVKTPLRYARPAF